MLDDNGLQVTGAIAFFDWMSDDADRRARGLEDAAKLMDQLAVLGATHIAAPPRGGTESTDLLRAAEYYRTLLELGDRTGVTPALEIWGFAPVCSRLGEAALIAIEAQHPKACILPDVYHLYKGGSGLGGVPKIGASILGGFHINDYSAQISPAEINDRDRVFPGDGDAPLVQLFRDLHTIQYAGPVSVELFNPEYYARPAEEVMATALSKTLGVISDALNG
jgi:sugar phosphate isomerase/epimerase